MGFTGKYAADKSYGDRFQATRTLTFQKILKLRILSQNSCKKEASALFLSNA